MKNRSFLIAIITLLTFLPQLVFSANQYYQGDTLYVWARSGLNMRVSADITAGKIQTLPYGTMVIVQNSKYPYEEETQKIRVIKSKTINEQKYPGYSIKGNWVKVIAGDKEGYLFDGFLSKMLPIETRKDVINGKKIVVANEHLISYLVRNFGKIKHIKTESEEDWHLHERIIYGNGAIYESSMTEKWGEESYMVPGMDLDDAYLFFNMIYFLEKSNKSLPEDDAYFFYPILYKVSPELFNFTIDEMGSSMFIKSFGGFTIVTFDYQGGC